MLRSRKGDAIIAAYQALIYDPPRQLDLFGSAAAYFGLDKLRAPRTSPVPKNLRSAEIGLQLHQHDLSWAGRS